MLGSVAVAQRASDAARKTELRDETENLGNTHAAMKLKVVLAFLVASVWR